jgi:hypothetical protein
MRYIKIISCTDHLMWYSHRVGDTVQLVREEEDYYISREPNGCTNIVHKKDAEVIDNE